jgi:hypothetical protein
MTPDNRIETLLREAHFDPSPPLDERILADAETALTSALLRRRKRWRIAGRLAIVAAIVAGVFAAWRWDTSIDGSRLAWADVVRQISVFRPYTCTTTIQSPQGQTLTYRETHLTLAQRREAFADGSVRVFDLSQSPVRILHLNATQKRAIEETLIGTTAGHDPDFLGMIAQLQASVMADTNTEDRDGHKTQRFHTSNQFNDITIWADVKTQLPIRIEIQHKPGNKIVLSEFDFAPNCDASLFSTTAPAGYTVEKTETDASPPTEKAFLEGLRAVANLLGGDFPPTFEWVAIQKTLGEYVAAKKIRIEDTTTHAADVTKKLRQALRYIELGKMQERMKNFTYAGQGARLGDKNTPIAWWQSRGSKTYHVIHADLTTRDADDAPQPTSKPSTQPTSTPSSSSASTQ